MVAWLHVVNEGCISLVAILHGSFYKESPNQFRKCDSPREQAEQTCEESHISQVCRGVGIHEAARRENGTKCTSKLPDHS